MDTMSAEVDAVHTEASAAADARGTTRTFVGNLEPSVTPEAADAAVLVVSELVTNALRHGGGRARWTSPHTRTASRWPYTTAALARRACAPPT